MLCRPLQTKNFFCFHFVFLFVPCDVFGNFGQATKDIAEKLPEICPRLHLYHKETGKCYLWGSQGPCKEMTYFYNLHNSKDYRQGECRCQRMEDGQCKVARPSIFWEETSQCFYLFDQGPCKENQWLVLDARQRPVCEDIHCPQKFARFTQKTIPGEVGSAKFLFPFAGKCYETGTEGFPQCAPGEKVFAEVRRGDFKFVCSRDGRQGLCFSRPGMSHWNNPPLPCSDGLVRDMYGECIPKVDFK